MSRDLWKDPPGRLLFSGLMRVDPARRSLWSDRSEGVKEGLAPRQMCFKLECLWDPISNMERLHLRYLRFSRHGVCTNHQLLATLYGDQQKEHKLGVDDVWTKKFATSAGKLTENFRTSSRCESASCTSPTWPWVKPPIQIIPY